MAKKITTEKDLRKKYPQANKASMLLPDEHTIWLPSRILAANHILGGGIPYGKLLEIFGYESTGKSLLALDFASVAQSLGGIVLWNDAERSFSNEWAVQNGLDTDRVEIYNENDIEGYSDWHRDMILYYRSQLTKNEPILLVVDSIAALDCKDNIDSDQSSAKAEMGNRAKALYKMYRMRTNMYAQYGVCVIMINQVRDKVGASMFEDSQTTVGGKATQFYASQRLAIVRSKQIKGRLVDGVFKEDLTKGYKVGQNVYLQVKKNKVAPPRENIKTQVYFLPEARGYIGFSKYHGLPEILENQGVITKTGSRYYLDGKMVCNGEANLIDKLHTSSKLRKTLLKDSNINTVSKTRTKLQALETNLFPV